MHREIDVLIISSQIGNERQITEDFKDHLFLVIKQISVTRQTTKMIDEMRQKSLALTEKLLYVIKQQVRVFRECQDSIYAAQEKREIPHNFQNLVNDNLEKLEREFPDIIRRIFRSFPKFCMELRKLSPRPFSSKVMYIEIIIYKN